MLQSLKEAIIRYPTSFGVWAMAVAQEVFGINEIAVVGPSALKTVSQINQLFIPNKVIQSSISQQEEFPLLQGKSGNERGDLIYLCRNYLCKEPVETVGKFRLLLKT